jgi:uncharacterized membrane protein YkoI
MNINFPISYALLIAFIVLGPFHTTFADDDHMEAKRLLETGEILPLEDLLKKLRQILPGKVLEIELEREDHQIVYEVELLGKDGVIKEVYINARTGKVLSIKEDD